MDSTHLVYARCCTTIEQLNQLASSSNRSNDKFRMSFFYNPPCDHQIYHITCELGEKIKDKDIDLVSDHTFYYKLDDKNLYRITCILISNSLIVQFLNKKIYDIEGEEKQEEYLTFSNAQRDNLELHLKEYLLVSEQIKKPNVNVLADTQPKL
jgi:hypothetical protein